MTDKISINAEASGRLSRANYGNRNGYDIQSTIFEKTLLHELTAYTKQSIVHFIDDRQACYDRQLPEIGLLVERSFGIHKTEAEVLFKTLKNFRHFLSSAYGISTEMYGGHYD